VALLEITNALIRSIGWIRRVATKLSLVRALHGTVLEEGSLWHLVANQAMLTEH